MARKIICGPRILYLILLVIYKHATFSVDIPENQRGLYDSLCPESYRFWHSQSSCVRYFSSPETWDNAVKKCRESMADLSDSYPPLALETKKYFSSNVTFNLFYNAIIFPPQNIDATAVWLRWRKRKVQLSRCNLELNRLHGPECGHEYQYFWYGDRAYRANLTDSEHKLEKLEHIQEIIRKYYAQASAEPELLTDFWDPHPAANLNTLQNNTKYIAQEYVCLVMLYKEGNINITIRNCETDALSFLCEFHPEEFRRTMVATDLLFTSYTGYQSGGYQTRQSGYRSVTQNNIPTYWMNRTTPCVQAFGNFSTNITSAAINSSWTFGMIDGPQMLTCYLYESYSPYPPQSGLFWASRKKAEEFCATLNSTLKSVNSLAAYYYSDALAVFHNNLLSGNSWLDAIRGEPAEDESTTVTIPFFMNTTSTTVATPTFQTTTGITTKTTQTSVRPYWWSNWQWSNGAALPSLTFLWTRDTESDKDCMVEQYSVNHRLDQSLPEILRKPNFVQWNPSSCDSRSRIICQKDLPAYQSGHSNNVGLQPTVRIRKVNNNPLSDVPSNLRLECVVENGTPVYDGSFYFFPAASAAWSLQSNKLDSYAIKSKFKTWTFWYCFAHGSSITNCPQEQSAFSGHLFSNFELVQMSGYYECWVLLRETLLWHRSDVFLLEDISLRFVFFVDNRTVQSDSAESYPGSMFITNFGQKLVDNFFVWLKNVTLFFGMDMALSFVSRGTTSSQIWQYVHVVFQQSYNQTMEPPQTATVRPVFQPFSKHQEAALVQFMADQTLSIENQFVVPSTVISYDVSTGLPIVQSLGNNSSYGSNFLKYTTGCAAIEATFGLTTFHWPSVGRSMNGDRPVEECSNFTVLRYCVGNFELGYSSEFQIKGHCEGVPEPSNFTDQLLDLLNVAILDAASAEIFRINLLEAVSNVMLTATDINIIGLLTERLAETASLLDKDVLTSVAHILSSVSDSPLEILTTSQSFYGSTNRLIRALETTAMNCPLLGDVAGSMEAEGMAPNITILAFVVPNDMSSTMVGFAANFGSENITKLSSAKSKSIQHSSDISMVLPQSLAGYLQNLSSSLPNGVRGQYHVFRSSKLFQTSLDAQRNDSSEESKLVSSYSHIASWIVGASFSVPVLDWHEPITITVTLLNFNASRKYQCAFWNTSAYSGHGAWQKSGCVSRLINNGKVTCECNHLTSFGVLVDFQANLDQSDSSLVKNKIFSALTTAALVLSIIGLSATIILIVVSRKVSRSRSSQPLSRNEFVILNLCAALILAYISFLAGVEPTGNAGSCVAAGVFIHYFFLVSFCWLAVEGFLLHQTFVKSVSGPVIDHFRIKSGVASWFTPLIIPIIVLSVNLQIYVGVQACWVGAGAGYEAAFYAGFIAPVCLVLVGNAFVFVVVIRELTCSEQVDIRSTKNKEDLTTELRRCITLFFLLGLPWIVISINISSDLSARTALHILTIIFCGTQGLAIFFIQTYGMRRELAETLGALGQTKFTSSGSGSSTAISAQQSGTDEVEMDNKKRF